MPSIAITSGVKDMQVVLNLVWDKLLPAMKPAPLATDDESRKKLEHRAGRLLRSVPRRVQAHLRKSRTRLMCFRPMNGSSKRSRSRVTSTRRCTLVARFGGVEQKIHCGHGAWQKGRLAYWPVTRATGGGQRCLDRGRHVHGQDLFLRNAVHRHDQM